MILLLAPFTPFFLTWYALLTPTEGHIAQDHGIYHQDRGPFLGIMALFLIPYLLGYIAGRAHDR